MSQDGTQAVRRAAAILRRIARVSDSGPPTLRSIAQELGLSRSTAHRILKCLTDTGLVSYDPKSRQYEMGMLSYELGLSVTDEVLGLARWCAVVDRIADRAKVTTYLMRRSGMEATCVHKAEGRSVVRAIPVEVGQRRYLGVGAGATALLAGLRDETIERFLDAIGDELGSFNDLDTATIREAIADVRRTGFAESWGRVYESVYGLGLTIGERGTEPDLAISIAVHAPAATDERIKFWKSILVEEIAADGNGDVIERNTSVTID